MRSWLQLPLGKLKEWSVCVVTLLLENHVVDFNFLGTYDGNRNQQSNFLLKPILTWSQDYPSRASFTCVGLSMRLIFTDIAILIYAR